MLGRRRPLVLASAAATVIGATIGVQVWADRIARRASRSMVRVAGPSGGSETVVVLGFRDRGRRRANPVNRWRVRTGLAAMDGAAVRSRLVLCGGTPGGQVPEAELMARYAVQERGFGGELVLEDRSRSTWQNMLNVIPLIEDADRIKIVSDPLHAERARLYLRHLRPDLAERLEQVQDNRFGLWAPLRPVIVLVGLAELAMARRRLLPDGG